MLEANFGNLNSQLAFPQNMNYANHNLRNKEKTK